MYREESAAASREVLDVAVPAMLWASWNSAGPLFANFLFDFGRGEAGVDVMRLRRLRDDALEVSGADQLGLTFVPGRQDLSAGCAA